jgi:glycosyltransferase involved in cell wall biosynthesis
MHSTCAIRVAHLVSHPIQYFAPLYRALSSRAEIDLTVYFSAMASLKQRPDPDFGCTVDWGISLVGGYRHVFTGVPSARLPSGRADFRPRWSILRELCRNRYDVLWLHGYTNTTAWLATAIARFQRIPVLLREEQTLLTPRSRLKRTAKQLIVPLLFRHVHGLYIGQSNRQFFEAYGSKRNFRAAYCVDNAFFQRSHAQLASSRAQLRRRFGIYDDSPAILFSGKLIDKKNPLLLLEAYRQVRRSLKCHLLFVGDGPLRPQLESRIERDRIPDVHLAGFLNQLDIGSGYEASDILVLPSAYQETWGLVVNEAMNFNLPIVVSDRVGCGADLVRSGENGMIFRSGDVRELSDVLQQLVASPELRRRFGLRSGELIADFSIEAVAGQIEHACSAVAGFTSRQSSAEYRRNQSMSQDS